MRYINKFMNYFLSNYLNNTRIYNYSTSLLKLFFERNNKNRDLFANLGNVFRNSKWSDLKVQNTKTAFISQYILTLLAVILVIVLCTYLIGLYNTQLSFNAWGITSFLIDVYSNATYSIGSTYFALYAYLQSIFNKKIDMSTKSLFVTKPITKKASPKQNFQAGAAPINYDLLKLTQSLYKTVWLNSLVDHNIHIQKFLTMSNTEPHYLLNARKNHQIQPNMVSDYNKPYDILNMKGLNLKHISHIVLTPLDFNKDPLAHNTNSDNINLDIAKQERWLTKNTPVSRSLATNNHLSLESKKLIGVNTTAKNFNTLNIWASNFYTQNNLDLFKNISLINQSNFKNYNFYEESNEFFMKRFMYLVNQPNLTIAKTITVGTDEKNNINTSNFYELNLASLIIDITNTNFISLNHNTLQPNFKANTSALNYSYTGSDFSLFIRGEEMLNHHHGFVFQNVQNTNNTAQYKLKFNSLLTPMN